MIGEQDGEHSCASDSVGDNASPPREQNFRRGGLNDDMETKFQCVFTNMKLEALLSGLADSTRVSSQAHGLPGNVSVSFVASQFGLYQGDQGGANHFWISLFGPSK